MAFKTLYNRKLITCSITTTYLLLLLIKTHLAAYTAQVILKRETLSLKIYSPQTLIFQLRFIFTEIQKRYLRHKNYRRVVANMDAQFPAASAEELTHHGMQLHCCAH